MRLRDRGVLLNEVLDGMMTEAARLKGKPYDLFFEWSDEHVYCSELVYKV